MSVLLLQLDYYENTSTKKYSVLKEYCQPTVKKYALENNMDYYCLVRPAKHMPTYNEKIKLYQDIFIHSQYSEYDQILYLDLDILIKRDSPNIFDISFEHLAGCLATKNRYENGISYTQNILKNNHDNFYSLINCSIRPNGGVLAFNKSRINNAIFSPNLEDILEDEMYLSYKIAYKDLSFTIMSSKWNCRNLINNDHAYFIHLLTNLFNDDGIDDTRGIELISTTERLLK